MFNWSNWFSHLAFVASRRRPCTKITVIFGSCFARTTGFIFDGTCSSDTEFSSPRHLPTRPALLSINVSKSGAMNVARTISINPQKCGEANKSLLSRSLLIRYFNESPRVNPKKTALELCQCASPQRSGADSAGIDTSKNCPTSRRCTVRHIPCFCGALRASAAL
jgi:hypothetical protein